MQLPNHGLSCKLFSADLSLRSIRGRDLQFPEPWHFLTSLPCHVHTFLSDRKFCGIFLFSLSIDAVSTRIREENNLGDGPAVTTPIDFCHSKLAPKLISWAKPLHSKRDRVQRRIRTVDYFLFCFSAIFFLAYGLALVLAGFPSGVGPRRLPWYSKTQVWLPNPITCQRSKILMNCINQTQLRVNRSFMLICSAGLVGSQLKITASKEDKGIE